jgi:hypothetical protein
MCGFWLGLIDNWPDYKFNGIDYFENSFIAVKKNNPLIEKWHFLMKLY